MSSAGVVTLLRLCAADGKLGGGDSSSEGTGVAAFSVSRGLADGNTACFGLAEPSSPAALVVSISFHGGSIWGYYPILTVAKISYCTAHAGYAAKWYLTDPGLGRGPGPTSPQAAQGLTRKPGSARPK